MSEPTIYLGRGGKLSVGETIAVELAPSTARKLRDLAEREHRTPAELIEVFVKLILSAPSRETATEGRPCCA